MSSSKSLSKYTEHGPLGSPSKVKASVNLAQEDIDFLEDVFPEWGSKTNIPGFLVARFCDALREDGITTAELRRSSIKHFDVLSSIDTFLSKPRQSVLPTEERFPL